MRLFIKNITLFLLPILVISIPVDLFLSSQLRISKDSHADEYSIWNCLFDGKVNSDIVIYGSSRAWVHIDPQIIEDRLNVSAFNLGIDAHNFWLQYLRHKVLLEYNRPPENIIMSVDFYTLQKLKNLYDPDQFLPYMLFSNLIRAYTKSYPTYSFFDYYLPLVRFYGKHKAIFSALKNSIVPINEQSGRIKGFKGQALEWNDDLQNAKTKMKYYEVIFDPELIYLFNDFIIECKEMNINVILVYAPEYIEGQNFLKNRKEVVSLFQNLADKYSIPFLDYSDDEMCKKKEYFYNASHLNMRGAKIFTNKLITDLEEIWNVRDYHGQTIRYDTIVP